MILWFQTSPPPPGGFWSIQCSRAPIDPTKTWWIGRIGCYDDDDDDDDDVDDDGSACWVFVVHSCIGLAHRWQSLIM